MFLLSCTDVSLEQWLQKYKRQRHVIQTSPVQDSLHKPVS